LTPSEADKGKTIYRLKFVPDALKEWQALDGSIKEPLRKTLKKRLERQFQPRKFPHQILETSLNVAGHLTDFPVNNSPRCPASSTPHSAHHPAICRLIPPSALSNQDS